MREVERRGPPAPRFVMVTGASSGIGRAAGRLADGGQASSHAARPQVETVTDGHALDVLVNAAGPHLSAAGVVESAERRHFPQPGDER